MYVLNCKYFRVVKKKKRNIYFHIYNYKIRICFTRIFKTKKFTTSVNWNFSIKTNY